MNQHATLPAVVVANLFANPGIGFIPPTAHYMAVVIDGELHLVFGDFSNIHTTEQLHDFIMNHLN